MSHSESFPNVIAETMIKGIPNISSNVGDAASIISNYGWVLSQNNYYELNSAVEECVDIYNRKNDFVKLQENCKKQIVSNYNINEMIINYLNCWKN